MGILQYRCRQVAGDPGLLKKKEETQHEEGLVVFVGLFAVGGGGLAFFLFLIWTKNEHNLILFVGHMYPWDMLRCFQGVVYF